MYDAYASSNPMSRCITFLHTYIYVFIYACILTYSLVYIYVHLRVYRPKYIIVIIGTEQIYISNHLKMLTWKVNIEISFFCCCFFHLLHCRRMTCRPLFPWAVIVFQKVTSKPCAADEYLDTTTCLCSSCADICQLRPDKSTDSSCQYNCPGMTKKFILCPSFLGWMNWFISRVHENMLLKIISCNCRYHCAAI